MSAKAHFWGNSSMPGKWWVGGPFILLASSIGLAQIRVTPPVMPLLAYTACALKVSGECALKAIYRSFEVLQDANHAVIVVLGPQAVRLKIADDLETSRQKGEISAEEAVSIAADLARLDGVKYEIPELEKLKSDLGFAKDSAVEIEDLHDLVRTHLQLIFGMQPSTAKYFTEQMGLENASSFEARVAYAFKPNRN